MWHLKEGFALKRVSIWRDNPNTLIRLEPVLSYWKEWRNDETPPSNLKRVFDGAEQELGHLPTPNVGHERQAQVGEARLWLSARWKG